MKQITYDEIRQRLESYIPHKIQDKKAKRAGVLVPLYGKGDQISIILTKRTFDVSIHKGEISFPGGVCEEGDSNTKDAALRECFEEIGVKIDDLKIIGRLDDIYTITGYLVSPYVGTVPYPYFFRTNDREVASLIFLPMARILEPDFQREDYCIFYNGEKIFGATFKILKNLSSVLISA
ncbi:MAG: CoA pyrophosphatase [Deltaproteobacteria bacterium]|nr:CoA pyrophosphatase [Deltaproteobacteria bacterium]